MVKVAWKTKRVEGSEAEEGRKKEDKELEKECYSSGTQWRRKGRKPCRHC